MKIMKLVKYLLFASLLGIIAGCKLAVIVVEGGEVQSTESYDIAVSDTCMGGTICLVEVIDTNFYMYFYAKPDAGWYFQKWNSGGRFFCADSTAPRCELSLWRAAGNAVIEKIVASSETFYLMPVFKQYKDTVVVDGKEWFQPSLFQGVAWDTLDLACPGGKCYGYLNGYEMNGWTWASIDDLNALFNHYIGFDALGPGPGRYSGYNDDPNPNPTWASDFYADGWRPTSTMETIPEYPEIYSHQIQGYVRDYYPGTCLPEPCHYAPIWENSGEFYDAPGPSGSTNSYAHLGYYRSVGAWFYRVP